MSWSLKEIYKALNKKFKHTENLKFQKVSIDSRKINSKEFFIPIVGKNYDGHNFIDEVSGFGVKACLVEKKKSYLVKNRSIHKIFVRNTQQSLQELASYARKRNKNLHMICITGSSGKTSLKEWTGKVLNEKVNTYVNPGNLNNEIGMPLSLVNMPLKTKVCILELGMNTRGEIKKLAKISSPTISIITNIGLAHIGNFEKPKDIAKEKASIYNYLNNKSFALIPNDSEYSKQLIKKASSKTKNIISFGFKENSDASFKRIDKNKFVFSILGKKISLKKKNYFKYWEGNTLIVLIILNILRFNFNDFKKRIENLRPLKGRGEKIKIFKNKKSFFLIDESYNSSPYTLKHSIFNANKTLKNNQKLVLVIGDMLELGQFSEELHLSILETVKKVSPKLLVTVGSFSKIITDHAKKNLKAFHYKTYHRVYERLIEELGDNDIVMIKGSNSLNLSKICERLKKK
tara:strand:- start:1474 stop:2853 length:1380 start_codon:yes stop_codon:yes gene_type:complete